MRVNQTNFLMGDWVLSVFVAGLVSLPASAQLVPETQKITPPAQSTVGARFGTGVGISQDGSVMVVGASFDRDNGTRAGSAYILTYDEDGEILSDRILPFQVNSNDDYGESVATTNTIAVVGAPGSNNDQGAVYIFDVTTGDLLHRRQPSGSDADRYGLSVAISGDIVIVGSYRDDDIAFNSGAAYIYNGATGAFLHKIRANDGEASADFGYSVGISGNVAIVGAWTDGDNAGAAYFFDVTTGQQIRKVQAGGSGERFGVSVAISGDTAIVGAEGNQTSGVGKAYLYNVTTGALIATLSGDGGDDSFGEAVAISGDVAVVGAYRDGGVRTGVAYMYDTATGARIAKIRHSDPGQTADHFGEAVAMSDTLALIGSPWKEYISGDNAGSAYLFHYAGLDTDSDGLLDDWELNGIPYADALGVEQRYFLPGADPNKKDLYVEVDAMTGFSLNISAQFMVQDAFGTSPVTNPDGTEGITLHIQADQTDLPHVPVWMTDGCWPLDFDAYRDVSFGTQLEQSDPDSVGILEAKAKAYRYCIVADEAGPNKIGGCGEQPGDNTVVFFGGTGSDLDYQAATFMHELGHNLGLAHGGCDHVNGKPNYPSVMNYLLADKMEWNEEFWRLDYSRVGPEGFAALDESSLDENAGIGTFSGFYSDHSMPYGFSETDGMGMTTRSIDYVLLDGSSTDFGDESGTMTQDGLFTSGVEQDLNYAPSPPAGIILPSTPSPGQVLHPHNDWANIALIPSGAVGIGFPAPVYPDDELTTDAIDWIDQNFPDPPSSCPADVNGDGDATPADFTAWLACFNNPALPGCNRADVNGDKSLTPADFTAWLAAFNVGCD